MPALTEALEIYRPLVDAAGYCAVVARRLGQAVRSYIYLRGKGDRPAERVLRSNRLTDDGFRSLLGDLQGNSYRRKR